MTEFEEKLVIENLDLVDKVICTRITWRASSVLMTYEDLQAVGREALCRAAMHYNPQSGPFAPFARKCIYNAVIDHCRNENAVRRMTGGSGDNEYGLDLIDKAGTRDSGGGLADALAARHLLNRYKKKYTGMIGRRGIQPARKRSIPSSGSRSSANSLSSSVKQCICETRAIRTVRSRKCAASGRKRLKNASAGSARN